MKRLWAPWRQPYITKAANASGATAGSQEECIFCSKPRLSRDRETYILHRGRRAFVILNLYPYNNGHIMVAPYRHISSFEFLDDDELAEMIYLVQRCEFTLKSALSCHGLNIGANIGRAAGAGFEEHLHIHLVPRWNGDHNFMSTLSDTKVISESLDASYDKLKKFFPDPNLPADLPLFDVKADLKVDLSPAEEPALSLDPGESIASWDKEATLSTDEEKISQ